MALPSRSEAPPNPARRLTLPERPDQRLNKSLSLRVRPLNRGVRGRK
jgi:hypothetical protein